MTAVLGNTSRITKDGKVARVRRTPAGQKKAAFTKATRQAKAWAKKSKGKKA